jgi:ATP-binding cassette, subfamily C (CFTR/MRP), member 1
MLFIFQLLFLAMRMQEPRLYTTIALSSEIVSSIAVLTALVLSFLEDQRSLSPSYILVLYFSASTICSLPRLRSLWIISSVPVPGAIWTVVNVGTAVVMVVESVHKTRWLSPLYRQSSTREQTAGFWSRSFFIWVLPFFQAGYTTDLQIDDIPPVDADLKEQSNESDLQLAWDRARARRCRSHLLLRTIFAVNKWPFLSAIIPRLALTAFTFCQPFLVNSSVSYVGTEPEERQKYYGEALVGAFALVYLGIAVSTPRKEIDRTC